MVHYCRKAFVGLKNAGATCYLNSVFQQLFMQPSIRRLILSAPEVARQDRADSVFYQLQAMPLDNLLTSTIPPPVTDQLS